MFTTGFGNRNQLYFPGVRNTILLSLLSMVCAVSGATRPAGLHTDIVYGQAGGETLRLDAFVPAGEGPFGVVLYVHGGGWSGGDKGDNREDFLNAISEAGFVWFSINYRLAPKHRWPACIEDVETAIRWVKAHAPEYKGDPERIALVGYSAGGHLACSAAIWAKEDTRTAAVVGFAPPIDMVADNERRGGLSPSMQNLIGRPRELDEETRAILKSISPVWDVRPGLPPFLLIHGTLDKSVPYAQSIQLQAALKEKGVACELVTIEGAGHRISEWDNYSKDYRQRLTGWLQERIGPHCKAAEGKPIRRIVVSADGTGDFASVQAAVDAVAAGNREPVVISIRPGTYKERIVVGRDKRFIRFAGEDAATTILTYDLYAGIKGEDGREIGTFRTPSVTIEADDFAAENITFENSAGPVGQAVAAAVLGDRCIFRNCRFLGWQDTLLDQTGRHYYENCTIAGHCDFIFGGGTAFFERCHIRCLDGNYITAASTPKDQPYGYVFSNCTITGPESGRKTHLGRPWRDYASVIFLNTEMPEGIRPEGWHNWGKPHREQTARYGEYRSTGPGARPEARVAWAKQLSDEEARQITVQRVLSGADGWDPLAGTVESSVEVVPASADEAAALKKKLSNDEATVYVMAVWRDDAPGLHLAHSDNGLEWTRIGGPILVSQIGTQKLMRRPALGQGADGTFHLVWQTDARGTRGLGYARSKDLVEWSEQKRIPLMEAQEAFDVASPTLFRQGDGSFVMVWASTLPGNYFQAYQEDVEDNPRLWYATTKDFETFSPAKAFFEPGYSTGQGALVDTGEGLALVHGDRRARYQTLRVSLSATLEGPWRPAGDAVPISPCFNPAALRIGEETLVYFENGAGGITTLVTRDFRTWTDVSAYALFPAGYRIGSIVKAAAKSSNIRILETKLTGEGRVVVNEDAPQDAATVEPAGIE